MMKNIINEHEQQKIKWNNIKKELYLEIDRLKLDENDNKDKTSIIKDDYNTNEEFFEDELNLDKDIIIYEMQAEILNLEKEKESLLEQNKHNQEEFEFELNKTKNKIKTNKELKQRKELLREETLHKLSAKSDTHSELLKARNTIEQLELELTKQKGENKFLEKVIDDNKIK